MATRAEKGETFWGYSIGRDGHLLVTRLEQPRYIGRDALLRIKLDNGKEITCTPDHQMMLCDGTMVMANELRAGTSLMPLYRNVSHGFEYVHQPLTGTYRPTHWLADEWNLRHNIYHDTPTTYRLHYDENHRNNRPENIMREHSRHHDVVATTTDQVMGQTTCLAIGQTIDQTIDEERVHVFATHHPTTTLNHKVVKVTELKGDHDVYCLTVPEAGNFALDAGVFVSNCGIIVNVTPLEPEWSGHVTIEISNTTPLPARIYANEGIGQVLFFEGDEPCERSYADKKGKYQSQEGIVLPRIDINS
jgi:dCTP deaminase